MLGTYVRMRFIHISTGWCGCDGCGQGEVVCVYVCNGCEGVGVVCVCVCMCVCMLRMSRVRQNPLYICIMHVQ